MSGAACLRSLRRGVVHTRTGTRERRDLAANVCRHQSVGPSFVGERDRSEPGNSFIRLPEVLDRSEGREGRSFKSGSVISRYLSFKFTVLPSRRMVIIPALPFGTE